MKLISKLLPVFVLTAIFSTPLLAYDETWSGTGSGEFECLGGTVRPFATWTMYVTYRQNQSDTIRGTWDCGAANGTINGTKTHGISNNVGTGVWAETSGSMMANPTLARMILP